MPLVLPNEGAIFNEDRTRRWWLGRCLERAVGVHRGRLLIIAVQPSTADEKDNDPTITREIKFAMSWGFRWLDKCNLFDLCSPDPSTLYGTTPPVLPVNDDYILAAAARATMILCAWGNHGAHLARGARMKRMLAGRGYPLYALGFTKGGFPIHPLARGKGRIPDSAQPQRWL